MALRPKKIAILGSTGHIAKSIIAQFCRTNKYELFLFARSLNRLSHFLKNSPCNNNNILLKMFSEFKKAEYDVVLNCVGISDPGKLKKAGISIFSLTETFDTMILNYLKDHPKALYINFSSGAAYGTDFSAPANKSTYTKLNINKLSPSDFYGISKIHAEAKHRSLKNLNIVDLRIFSYYTRFINLEDQYFMTELIACLKNNKEFKTNAEDVIRDYVHPKDMISLIEKSIAKHSINDVFDVYSLRPTTKFEILNYFSKQYGLKYLVKKHMNISTATGTKIFYYSTNKKAEKIGYFPKFTSLATVIEETKAILKTAEHRLSKHRSEYILDK